MKCSLKLWELSESRLTFRTVFGTVYVLEKVSTAEDSGRHGEHARTSNFLGFRVWSF